MTSTIDWTEERALVAARNSDITGYAWRAESGVTEPLAHQFPTDSGWMRSRCGEVRWTVRWWTSQETDARCPDCAEMSEQAIEREARAILAVAAAELGDWSPGELSEAWGR